MLGMARLVLRGAAYIENYRTLFALFATVYHSIEKGLGWTDFGMIVAADASAVFVKLARWLICLRYYGKYSRKCFFSEIILHTVLAFTPKNNFC